MMEEFMGEDFDFSRDANWTLERDEICLILETTEEAREIWRTKVKFDLLTLKLGDTSVRRWKRALDETCARIVERLFLSTKIMILFRYVPQFNGCGL